MNPPPSEERIGAWRALMRAHAAVTDEIDRVLQDEVGIPGPWYEALVEIAFAGGSMRMSEFAEETTLTKSGATRFADRLEEAGLVERRRCPTDRRGWELVLTAPGKQMQRRADPHVLDVIHRRFGSWLTDEEAGIILAALTRVSRAEKLEAV
ncbi:MAG TPA: MarR family transcriptional regulator [Acidimicrobiia bacterium]|nr:MarR family transcriptional regulator [Acidimicrobiia bacterium]